MKMTPIKLRTKNVDRVRFSKSSKLAIDIHPAISSFLVKFSLRKMAPDNAVDSGTRNVKTVASDSERYLRAK